MRERVVVGNWKMYKTQTEAESYLTDLLPRVKEAKVGVYLAVPFTALEVAASTAAGSALIIGAQNMNDATEGAFTGEISARMLTEAGARFVILGHSERRRFFGETDAFINRKVRRALETDDLRPILCVGETLEEHRAGKTKEVLERQLTAGLADVSPDQIDRVMIAYEPVWAIGTGETATPEVAEEAHQFIRQFISSHWDDARAQSVLIIYGGSVQPNNCSALTEQPDIDGLLVGGASLVPELFSQIVNAYKLPVGKEIG